MSTPSASQLQSPVALLCPELLTEVLTHVLVPDDPFDRRGTSVIVPLLRVNKSWLSIAERQLYRSISLSDPMTAHLLSHTLAQSVRLASLVSRLHLGTPHHIRDETRDHITILRQCVNVRHVKISGYNGYELESYRSALRLKSLISFAVSRYGLADWEGDGFCTISELLDILSCWPKLEKVLLYSDALAPSGGFEDKLYKLKACPYLKDVDFRDIDIAVTDIFSLSAIAPSVEKLRISSWPGWSDQPDVLVSSLRQWANSLHHLYLYAEEERGYPPTPIFPPPIDAVFPSLIHLSYLYISSVQLAPASLQAAYAPLKNIHYWATLAEWEELQWSLAKPEVLPSLEKCTVSLAPEKGSRFSSFAKHRPPEALMASLREVGASRGVEMVFYP